MQTTCCISVFADTKEEIRVGKRGVKLLLAAVGGSLKHTKDIVVYKDLKWRTLHELLQEALRDLIRRVLCKVLILVKDLCTAFVVQREEKLESLQVGSHKPEEYLLHFAHKLLDSWRIRTLPKEVIEALVARAFVHLDNAHQRMLLRQLWKRVYIPSHE